MRRMLLIATLVFCGTALAETEQEQAWRLRDEALMGYNHLLSDLSAYDMGVMQAQMRKNEALAMRDAAMMAGAPQNELHLGDLEVESGDTRVTLAADRRETFMVQYQLVVEAYGEGMGGLWASPPDYEDAIYHFEQCIDYYGDAEPLGDEMVGTINGAVDKYNEAYSIFWCLWMAYQSYPGMP